MMTQRSDISLSSQPHSVLFVCGMNSIRSPMASALTKTLYKDQIHSRSAGVERGNDDAFVQAVMNEIDIDVSYHSPHTLDELEDAHFDLVVTLTEVARVHVETHALATKTKQLEHWPIDDPTIYGETRDQKLFAYRSVRDDLKERIVKKFGTFTTENTL